MFGTTECFDCEFTTALHAIRRRGGKVTSSAPVTVVRNGKRQAGYALTFYVPEV